MDVNNMEVVLNKDMFIKLVNTLDRYNTQIDKLQEGIGSGNIEDGPLIDIMGDTIELLLSFFYTKDEVYHSDRNLIDYFMWDLDFGREWYEGAWLDDIGHDIALRNVEDLWNALYERWIDNE